MMTEALQATKLALRKEIKTKLTQISSESKLQQSNIIINKLFSLKDFRDSKRISVYLSTENEVNTVPILKRIFEDGKLCYVPRYNKNVMEMVRLKSMEDYETLPLTKWNIKQPNLKEERDSALETGGLDLIIVPGVAFTLTGKRLGHGKGYYDIFLNKLKNNQQKPMKTIALSFTEQMLKDIPCNEDDFILDTVLSPQTCIENTE